MSVIAKKSYGTGEKVILSVEDDDAAYLLLELSFNEVGGDFSLHRVADGMRPSLCNGHPHV